MPKIKKEIATPLGDRVYKKHHKMIRQMKRLPGKRSRAKIVQQAIEEKHAREITS